MENTQPLENPISAGRSAKGDRRAGTPTALVDAARQIIRAQGDEALTLASSAERAGIITGAIHGNFKTERSC